MQEYVDRLIRCGLSPSEAYSTCVSFIKHFSLLDLQMFISSIEKERQEAPNVG